MLSRNHIELIQSYFFDPITQLLISDPILITDKFEKQVPYTKAYSKIALETLLLSLDRDLKRYAGIQTRLEALNKIIQGTMGPGGNIAVPPRNLAPMELGEYQRLSDEAIKIEHERALKVKEKARVHKAGFIKDPLNPNILLSNEMLRRARDGKTIMSIACAAVYESISKNPDPKNVVARDFLEFYGKVQDVKESAETKAKLENDLKLLAQFLENSNNPALGLSKDDIALLATWGIKSSKVINFVFNVDKGAAEKIDVKGVAEKIDVKGVAEKSEHDRLCVWWKGTVWIHPDPVLKRMGYYLCEDDEQALDIFRILKRNLLLPNKKLPPPQGPDILPSIPLGMGEIPKVNAGLEEITGLPSPEKRGQFRFGK